MYIYVIIMFPFRVPFCLRRKYTQIPAQQRRRVVANTETCGWFGCLLTHNAQRVCCHIHIYIEIFRLPRHSGCTMDCIEVETISHRDFNVAAPLDCFRAECTFFSLFIAMRWDPKMHLHHRKHTLIRIDVCGSGRRPTTKQGHAATMPSMSSR